MPGMPPNATARPAHSPPHSLSFSLSLSLDSFPHFPSSPSSTTHSSTDNIRCINGKKKHRFKKATGTCGTRMEYFKPNEDTRSTTTTTTTTTTNGTRWCNAGEGNRTHCDVALETAINHGWSMPTTNNNSNNGNNSDDEAEEWKAKRPKKSRWVMPAGSSSP